VLQCDFPSKTTGEEFGDGLILCRYCTEHDPNKTVRGFDLDSISLTAPKIPRRLPTRTLRAAHKPFVIPHGYASRVLEQEHKFPCFPTFEELFVEHHMVDCPYAETEMGHEFLYGAGDY
jgi:hypothetical protein